MQLWESHGWKALGIQQELKFQSQFSNKQAGLDHKIKAPQFPHFANKRFRRTDRHLYSLLPALAVHWVRLLHSAILIAENR